MMMLYVDDDATLRRCVGQDLRREFGEVDTAKSVADALPRISKATFVVTDWNLGDGLGQQIVDECQKHDVPCVVFSGNLTLETSAPVVRKGSSKRLVDVVREMLQ